MRQLYLTRLAPLLRILRAPRARAYSPAAYACGALLPGRREGREPVAWLRGAPRPELRPGRGCIRLGHVGLYPGVRLHCLQEGAIEIASGTFVNRHTRIVAARGVRIGRDCMLSWDVVVSDAAQGGAEAQPIDIGDGAWIGARAVILGGTRLGPGCIVAAGSVVRGEFAPGALIAGRPAEAAA